MAEYSTFSEVRARLDEIVVEVRRKDLSLEKSLDLYEEAIALGNRCAELVDNPDFTAEEARAAEEALGAVAAAMEEPEEAEAQSDASEAETAEEQPEEAAETAE